MASVIFFTLCVPIGETDNYIFTCINFGIGYENYRCKNHRDHMLKTSAKDLPHEAATLFYLYCHRGNVAQWLIPGTPVWKSCRIPWVTWLYVHCIGDINKDSLSLSNINSTNIMSRQTAVNNPTSQSYFHCISINSKYTNSSGYGITYTTSHWGYFGRYLMLAVLNLITKWSSVDFYNPFLNQVNGECQSVPTVHRRDRLEWKSPKLLPLWVNSGWKIDTDIMSGNLRS